VLAYHGTRTSSHYHLLTWQLVHKHAPNMESHNCIGLIEHMLMGCTQLVNIINLVLDHLCIVSLQINLEKDSLLFEVFDANRLVSYKYIYHTPSNIRLP